MYQQPNYSYESNESLRRFSSNNPFRRFADEGQSSNSRVASPAYFEKWVSKNQRLAETSSDEDDTNYYQGSISRNYNNRDGAVSPGEIYQKPKFPARPTRTGSDSSVNYGERKMSSNNPFASALEDGEGYEDRRAPPVVPRPVKPQSRARAQESVPPPAYEEVAEPERVNGDYPREKERSSSSRHGHRSSSRPHRSQSESAKHHSSGRDREKRRHNKSSRNKSPSKKQSEPVKSKNMDTIDKLDFSGFFGGGFHHDGPFDACTPHRNKNVKAAPVMAFPMDGPNNSISGSAGKNDALDKAFGNYDENDQNEIVGRRFAMRRTQSSDNNVPVIKTNRTSNDPLSTYNTPKHNPSVIDFDSKSKAEPIHGSTTAGLGSSTFVDGAPAPKPVQDDFLHVPGGGGLARKKSLVQRLRGQSEGSSRRSSVESGETRSELYGESDDAGAGSSLLRRVKSLKVRR